MESNCPLCGHELPEGQGIRVDEGSGFITLDGEEVKASRRDRQVLGILINKSPRVVSRAFIMDNIYGLLTDKEEPDEKITTVFICKVRQAIRNTDYEIKTVWGRGWIFRRKLLHNGREEHQREAVQIPRNDLGDRLPC